MSDAEQALYAILANDTAVSALVGTRIFPNVIPQDVALPVLAYMRVSGARTNSQTGPSQLARPRFQITCLSRSYSEAKTLAAAVRRALDGYKGAIASVDVQGVMIQNEFDTFTDDDDLHTVRQDYYFWHAED